MKTISKRKATGTLGKMVSEVNPDKLAKMRNRMLIAAKIADAMHFLLASLSFFGLNSIFVKATTGQGEYLASKMQFNLKRKK